MVAALAWCAGCECGESANSRAGFSGRGTGRIAEPSASAVADARSGGIGSPLAGTWVGEADIPGLGRAVGRAVVTPSGAATASAAIAGTAHTFVFRVESLSGGVLVVDAGGRTVRLAARWIGDDTLELEALGQPGGARGVLRREGAAGSP